MAIALTAPLGKELNEVSVVPSAFSRAFQLGKVPWLKLPPTITALLVCTANARTELLMVLVGRKLPSTVPLEFKRAIRVRAVPLIEVKSPPMTMRPSACKAIDQTLLETPLPVPKKVESSVPSENRRASRTREKEPSTAVN